MKRVHDYHKGLWFIGVFALVISFTTIPAVQADASYREDTRAGPMTNEQWIYSWYKTHPEGLLYSTDMAYSPFKIMAFPQDYGAQPGSGNAPISAWRPALPSCFPLQGISSPIDVPLASSLEQPIFNPVNGDPNLCVLR
jgi:hypothetical protein